VEFIGNDGKVAAQRTDALRLAPGGGGEPLLEAFWLLQLPKVLRQQQPGEVTGVGRLVEV
jgi:hypothetical protein